MRPPDITGDGVEAWEIKLPEVQTTTSSLLGFLVRCTWAHPFWDRWVISVQHLREMEGQRPALKQFPEAEYELLIVTLDPEHEADPDHPERGYRFMEPVDLVFQFHGLTDRDAARLCRLAVETIAAGRMSPDQDFRSAWETLLQGTVECMRNGNHLEH